VSKSSSMQNVSNSSQLSESRRSTQNLHEAGGHHRKSVISSTAQDVSNAVLHRKSNATHSESQHVSSMSALSQKKSISNLAESSSSYHGGNQQSNRVSLSTLHRHSNDAALQTKMQTGQSSYDTYTKSKPAAGQRVVRQDNLSVGGAFYGQSEAKYGNFGQTQQRTSVVDRTAQRTKQQSSHIAFGSAGSDNNSSYRKEYVVVHSGTCPAALLETEKSSFRHQRDTKEHKFYTPKSGKK
jgi:hypothetical protein